MHTEREDNQYGPECLANQTPCNLSALDTNVWVLAYFVLDCCHFVIFVPFFFHKRRELKGLCPPPKKNQHLVWRVGGGGCTLYRGHIQSFCWSQSTARAPLSSQVWPLCLWWSSPITSPQSQKHFNPSQFSLLVKISICKQIVSITRRELSHPPFSSQWTFTAYYWPMSWKHGRNSCLLPPPTPSSAFYKQYKHFVQGCFSLSFQSKLFVASKWWARRCCWRAADKRGASRCMFTAIF